MKKMIAIIAVLAAVTTTTFAGSTTEVLQKKLDAAIAASDWKTAETISAVMANVTTAANHQQQADFFRQNNEFMQGVMNVYKAAPQLLNIAQRLMPGEKGTEEHLFLNTLAPAVIKLISDGAVDTDKIVSEVKEHQRAERARWAEREKLWKRR